jgi:hypothetical protein
MFRKVYEVTGYIDRFGDCYCPAHVDDVTMQTGDAIFLGEEWDSAPYCHACLCAIECTIIGEQD